MALVRVVFSILASLGLAGTPLAAQEQPIQLPPLSAYGQLPEIEDAAISPSGKHIAALLTVNDARVLAMFGEGNTLINRLNVDDLKIRSFDWVGEDRLLLVYSTTQKLGFNFTTDKHEFYTALILPADPNGEGGTIFGKQRNLVNAVFGVHGVREIDGRWYGFFGALELQRDGRLDYRFKHGRPYLYRVDLEELSVKKIENAANEISSRDWLVDAQGNVAVTFDINDENGRWEMRGPGKQVLVEGQSPSGRAWLIGLGKDGTTAIYGERDGEAETRWYEIALTGGTPEPFLEDLDVERLYFDDQTGHLSGYLLDNETPQPVFFNPAESAAARKVRQAFRELEMRMVDWTDDLNHMIVRTSGNMDSGSWFTVDVANLTAQAFAYERNAILPQHVGNISTFEYAASDGLEMDGILTLPPGREAKQLPLVMLPHGGPHSYDSESFDWWAQAFASRGYAVFQPNFRGSTNRDGAFRRAGYGEWGRKMQTDKSDGMMALAEAGIIDPERACIVGASYGGYAALAGVTLQQGLYKCAVAVAPVSDIKRMYLEDYRATGNERTTKVALLEQLGPRETWDAVSPHRHASNADAPILLIHGKDDTVVPYTHSTRMADALKDAGKPYELVTLDGEDHWLSKSETRKTMLETAVSFVERHNPPD
ncbi:alpha/beta hydrolase family protein [Altererythrobacter sp. GH1-8]|uniref:alpha/beta hydrolase family protein n=1 Tax=Altererythrobacter sp. GH1-8 TaxID=3349333 RepID=UPI00374D2BAB